jgi:hypothetical protein
MPRRKLPSFQFYPGDWLKDPNLRRCSRAARGAWIDMLCLMFECDTRGVLSAGGVPWSDQEIAAAIGGDIAGGLSCIDELLRLGVAHRTESGAIYSRRMVRDEELRQIRSKAGKQGGNPALLNHKPPKSGLVKQNASKREAKGQAKSGSSSSSSTSVKPPASQGGIESGGARAGPTGEADESKGRQREFIEAFCSRWEAKYGIKYSFVGGKDGKAVEWFRAELGENLDWWVRCVEAFLASNDKFIADNGHSLGVLRVRFATFKVAGRAATASDEQHAKRSAAVKAQLAPERIDPAELSELLPRGKADAVNDDPFR